MNLKAAFSKLSRCFISICLLSTLLVTSMGSPLAEEQPQQAATASPPSFDEIRSSLDEAEKAIGREDVSADSLVELRDTINAIAAKVREQLEEIEPRAREIEERLKQLGPRPAKDAPPKANRSLKNAKS